MKAAKASVFATLRGNACPPSKSDNKVANTVRIQKHFGDYALRVHHALDRASSDARPEAKSHSRRTLDDSYFIYLIVVMTCSVLVHVGIPAFEF